MTVTTLYRIQVRISRKLSLSLSLSLSCLAVSMLHRCTLRLQHKAHAYFRRFAFAAPPSFLFGDGVRCVPIPCVVKVAGQAPLPKS